MKRNKKHKCPNYSELFLDVLKVIEGKGGSASIDEIVDKVIERRAFSDDIVDELHPGSTVTTELEYQLAWARTYLKKSGYLERSKNGVWALTRSGSELCKLGVVDKRAIVKNATRLETKSNSNGGGQEKKERNELRPWKERLSEILHNMNPYAFERLAQRVLRECEFEDVVVTKKSSDGGIDGTGKLRINGIFSFNVAFQCKRYKGQVGSSEIRNFRGSLDQNIEKGVLITTGSFTRAAKDEASAPGKQQIDLMDGNMFMDKLAEHELGLTMRKEYDIDESFFANLEE